MNLGEIITLGITITTSFSLILGIVSYFLIFPLYKEASEIEVKILDKKKEINELPDKVLKKANGYLNQSQFEKVVERDKKPLLYELDVLETKRKFILDKLPLISFMKK